MTFGAIMLPSAAPRRLLASSQRLRQLSSAKAARVGVLQVYRLELADQPPPQKRVRLLFPAGVPRTNEETAAQLASAAERGDPVFVPASALHRLLGDDMVQLQLNATADGAPRKLLEAGSAAHALVTRASGSSEVALALAEVAVPLSDALAGSGAVSHPDWRTTTDLEVNLAASVTPAPLASEAQHSVLSAAASADTFLLAKAIAACPADELVGATLAPSGATALHLAAAAGALPAVRMLLDAGTSVHAIARNGSTALHWAAGSGHASIVGALLAAGSSTRARSSTWRSTVRGNDSGQTAAHWAAASGHTEVLELLLAEDPHALLLEDERQMSVSAVAARDGHPWLQSALDGLMREQVVCVRISRETTLARSLGDIKSSEQPEEGAGVLGLGDEVAVLR